MKTDREITALAAAAAARLEGFTVARVGEGMSETSVILAHPDGRALDIYRVYDTRAAIRGIFPPTRMEIRSWPEITVAIARGPRALAAEIRANTTHPIEPLRAKTKIEHSNRATMFSQSIACVHMPTFSD